MSIGPAIVLSNCFDCIWRRGDECHKHLDENGNPEPIYDEPAYCSNYSDIQHYTVLKKQKGIFL